MKRGEKICRFNTGKKTGNVMCAGVVEVRNFSMNVGIEKQENEQERKLMKTEKK